jgi:hypothetical protein
MICSLVSNARIPEKNTIFLSLLVVHKKPNPLYVLCYCICHNSLILIGQYNRLLILIGLTNVQILRWHIGPVTNPTLFGIIKTPAASHSNTSNTCISLSNDTPHAISYASLQKKPKKLSA